MYECFNCDDALLFTETTGVIEISVNFYEGQPGLFEQPVLQAEQVVRVPCTGL